MGFSRQEYWGGLPYPLPGDLPNLRNKPISLMSLALEVGSLPLGPPGKPSHPGDPGPGQGTKILLQATTHSLLSLRSAEH